MTVDTETIHPGEPNLTQKDLENIAIYGYRNPKPPQQWEPLIWHKVYKLLPYLRESHVEFMYHFKELDGFERFFRNGKKEIEIEILGVNEWVRVFGKLYAKYYGLPDIHTEYKF